MSNNIKDFRFSIYINNDAARKSLIELEQTAEGYTRELEKLANAGKKNSLEYDRTKAKLDQVKNSMHTLSQQAGINSLSITQLTSLHKALAYELSMAIPGTEKWKKLDADIKAVKARMGELKNTNEQAGMSIGRMADKINRYIGMVTMAAATITGMVMGIRKAIEAYAKWDDKLADVMKTTQQTKDQVIELDAELRKISTRTSREELLNLARDAGKLGIEGKRNILDFVEAGNQIKVSLGEDLGEDAIKSIGKMVGVYERSTKHLQSLSLKEQMLAVGSAINELGASSTASEPYLVSFAGRLGGVAKQAGISIDAILGYASALDQDMQAVEMSATAFQKFIMKLMADPAKFAQLAGLEVNKFSKLLSTDTNAAIKLVLRSLNEKGGFQALIPVFQDMGLDGARAVGVLSSMAGSIEKIETAQKISTRAMREGISITEEYDKKNNNAQAGREKSIKKFNEMAVTLGEKLAPAFTFSTSSMSYFLRSLGILIEFAASHSRTILTTITALAAYTIATQVNLFWIKRHTEGTAANTLVTKIGTLFINARILAEQLWAATTMLLTGNIKGATQAMRVFNAVAKTNAFGLIAAALATVVGYLILFRDRTKDATDYNQVYTDSVRSKVEELTKEKVALSTLVTQIMQTNDNIKRRHELIEKLKQDYPGYLNHIKTEEITNQDLLNTLVRINETYREKYRLAALKAQTEAREKQMTDIETRKIEIEEKILSLRSKFISSGSQQDNDIKALKQEYATLETKGKAVMKQIQGIADQQTKIISNLNQANDTSLQGLKDKLSAIVKSIEITQNVIDSSSSEQEIAHRKESLSLYEREKELLEQQIEVKEKEEAEEKKRQAEQKKQNQDNLLDQQEKETAYEALNKKISETEKLLRSQIDMGSPLAQATADELKRLRERKQAIDDVYDSYLKLDGAKGQGQYYMNYETSYRENDSSTSFSLGPPTKLQEKLLNDVHKAQQEQLKTLLEQGKLTTGQYQAEIEAMELAHMQNLLEIKRQAGEDTDALEKQIFDKTLNNLKQSEDRQKEQIMRHAELYTTLGNSMGGMLENMISGQIKSFEDFGKAIIAMMFDILAKIVDIKIAEASAIALASPDSVLTFGAAGLARAAILGALIKGVLAGVKGLILADQNFEGRYPITGAQDGRTYMAGIQKTPKTGLYTKPTFLGGLGLVAERGDEIVISNPHVRHLQMNYPEVIRTIMATRVPQFAQGRYPAQNQQGQGQNQSDKDDIMVALMQQMVELLNRPTRAYIPYNDLNDAFNKVTEIENSLK